MIHLDIMPAVLAILVLGVIWSIYRLHRDPKVNFNLLDLLIENGRVSKIACIVMGAFAVTTWGFVLDCLNRKGLDAVILAAYGGLWVSPLLLKLYNAGQADPAPVTVTTTTAAATTTTTPVIKKKKK